METSQEPSSAVLGPAGNGVADTSSTVPQNPPAQGISADEIALYDRQIRLWGVQAQERLRTANILLIGMKALGNEIAKNLVLAGVGSLTIVDDDYVVEEDLGAQFLISEEHIGVVRSQAALPELQRLNPRVRLSVAALAPLISNPEFFSYYTLIIATDLSFPMLNVINMSTRISGRPFYVGCTFGLYGCIFADLIKHTFIIEREKPNVETTLGKVSPTQSIINVTSTRESNGKTKETVTKQETYTPINLANTSPLSGFYNDNRRKLRVSPLLSLIRALWDYQSKPEIMSSGLIYPNVNSQIDLGAFTTLTKQKHLELQLPIATLTDPVMRTFMANLGSELAPTAAFVGGQLAQDVINVIGGKEQPIQNFMVFDGEDTKGPVYALHTELPDILGNGTGDVGGVVATDAAAVGGGQMMVGGDAAGMGMNGNGNGMGLMPGGSATTATTASPVTGHARSGSNGSTINMSMPV